MWATQPWRRSPRCPAENEARAFAKSEGWETEDVEEIALRVRHMWPGWRRAVRAACTRAMQALRGCSRRSPSQAHLP